MDKRLLPYGFVWGVSLVAVYAAVLTFFFSHISTMTPVWSFVLGALLAAIYTHLDGPELPIGGAFRVDRMKKNLWHNTFWTPIVLFVTISSSDILFYFFFDFSFDMRVWDLPFMAALVGWFSTRMPYLMSEKRLKEKAIFIEWTCILILLQLVAIYYSFVERERLFSGLGLLLNLVPILMFCGFYKIYKEGRLLPTRSSPIVLLTAILGAILMISYVLYIILNMLYIGFPGFPPEVWSSMILNLMPYDAKDLGWADLRVMRWIRPGFGVLMNRGWCGRINSIEDGGISA